MVDGHLNFDTELNEKGFNEGMTKLGSIAKTGFSVLSATFVAGLGAATAAAGALVKTSVEGYADYEQLTGGVETLFKTSSSTVMDYAKNAYQTAGLTANSYMETITGFSASLLQGLGGDTEKAAQIGNMAVTDMADNANKMGTNMTDIQNAYQGFAKQNYTMLDNLKLGYGGTKEEMERLLVDAEKLTGVHYDISNFSDVIEAIHAIQDETGITGTTAKEAATTISGSLEMTKSAWSNLVTGMADDDADFDQLIDNFVDSAASLGQNLLPRIEIAIKGVGELITKLLPPIMNEIPAIISDILPGLLSAGASMVSTIGSGIMESLPTLIEYAMQMVQMLTEGLTDSAPAIADGAIIIVETLVNGVIELLPSILELGAELILNLIQGISDAFPTLLESLVGLFPALMEVFTEIMPQFVQTGMNLLINLVNGILGAIPLLLQTIPGMITQYIDTLVSYVPILANAGIQLLTSLVTSLPTIISTIVAVIPQIITNIIDALLAHLPDIVQSGFNLLTALITDLPSIIVTIISSIPQIISSILSTLASHIPDIISMGFDLLVSLVENLPGIISAVVSVIPEIVSGIIDTFGGLVGGMADVGLNLIKGIWGGISDATGWLYDKITGFGSAVVDKIKSVFGIHSPSRIMRDEVGKYLALGVGVGMDDNMPVDEMQSSVDKAVASLQASVDDVTCSVPISSANAYYSNMEANNTLSIDYDKLSDAMKDRPVEINGDIHTTVELDKQAVGEAVEPIVSEKLADDARGRR